MLVAMGLGVMQARFIRMLVGMKTMTMGDMRMVSGLFMVAILIVI